MTKYLSFPGLGIGPFHISDTAFSLFGIDIKWYGVIITVGMILAFFVARNRAKYEGITGDDIYDVTLACIVFGVIGARVYYILFKLSDFIVTDAGSAWGNVKESFLSMVNIRGGGLAIYGGIIAGVLTIIIAAKIKKIRLFTLLDVASPAVLIGQVLGRWGNFVNVEAFGSETALPWRMGIHTTYGEAGEWASEAFVHPTFLYESLWNLVALVLIFTLYNKKKYNGQVTFFYLAWYGLGRSVIEGLRTDSLMLGPVRISQLVAIVTFVVGTVLFIWFMFKTPKAMRLVPERVVTESAEAADESPVEEEKISEDTENIAESENENGETD